MRVSCSTAAARCGDEGIGGLISPLRESRRLAHRLRRSFNHSRFAPRSFAWPARSADPSYDDASYFAWSGAAFSRALKRYPPSPQAGGSPKIGIVVMPWVRTPAPWYAIMLAFGLQQRGSSVALLWDDTGFPREDPTQKFVIRRVLSRLRSCPPVIRLSDQKSSSDAAGRDAAGVTQLSDQIVTWWLRGDRPDVAAETWSEHIRVALAERLPLVRAVVDLDLECILVPGGVLHASGLYFLAAAGRRTRVATFDADRGVAQLCVDGVAAQNGDLPRAFKTLLDEPRETRDKAIEIARAEFGRRADGSDRYGYQVVASQQTGHVRSARVLIPLNVEWDTAALGRHKTFHDTVDWLTTTVRTVLDLAADHEEVVVRQHPSERRPGQRSRLDLEGILGAHFGDDSRYSFVSATDPISSYDLLRSAEVVLPFTSNIGIEAAALGKTVLVAGSSFYADLGFTWSPRSRDEYLHTLQRALARDLPPLADQQERAWLCYYLVAVRNRVWTDFTSTPADFAKWVRRSPTEVFRDPEVADMLAALDDDVPVSLLRHERARIAGEW